MNLHKTALSNLPAIKPGHFLVLHGDQGSGKSTLARRIAMTRGNFAQIAGHEVADSGVLAYVLSLAPSTLIIESEGLNQKELAALKSLVTSSHVDLRAPHGQISTRMAVPPVIVVSQEAAPWCDMRRAQLHRVGGAA